MKMSGTLEVQKLSKNQIIAMDYDAEH